MTAEPSRPAVRITFDCTPLRGCARLDIPIDASPVFRSRLERMQRAVARHGTRNTYYLTNASCTFQLTNDPMIGMVEFAIEGTLLTDELDSRTVGSDLEVKLVRETCDWLTEPAVKWLCKTAERAVQVEFDRYIAAGDLSRTLDRLAKEQAAIDAGGGYLGMNL